MTLQEYTDSFLLDTILPVVRSTIESEKTVYSLLEKTTRDIKGDQVISKTQFQSNQGLGWRAPGEKLPASTKPKFKDAVIGLAYGYGQMDIKGQDKILSGNAKPTEAVQSILSHSSKDLTKSFSNELELAMWGDGSGKITTVSGPQGPVTTINVVDASGFYLGQLIDIHELVVLEDCEVVAKTATTITLGAEVTVTDGTVITRADSKDNVLVGLKKMLFPDTDPDTWGSYEGIPRDTYHDWRPVFLYNTAEYGTARNLTLDLIDELVFACYDNGCSENLVMVMPSSLMRAVKKLRQVANYPTEYTDIRLGWKAPKYETPETEIPMITARRCWSNSIVLLDLDDISIRRPLDMSWQFGNNGTILRVVEGYDMERATLMAYMQLFNVMPKHSGVLTDVQFPT